MKTYVVERFVLFMNNACVAYVVSTHDDQAVAEKQVDIHNRSVGELLGCHLVRLVDEGKAVPVGLLREFLVGLGIKHVAHGMREFDTQGLIDKPTSRIIAPH